MQPPQYLHVTLQRLNLYRDQLSEDQWLSFLGALDAAAQSVSEFKLGFSLPRVHGEAVEAFGTPRRGWDNLVDAIRTALGRAGFQTALTDPPFGPHYTFAYCTADTGQENDTHIQKVLDQVCQPQSMVVDSMHLVAVNQYPDEGVFRFDRLHSWPLKPKVS
ncbi:2'-5' RNA ligase [Bifidobacterium xylocopae]|uniref:2'-5' RNA ligase n=1 Tax=Bifidobacterium xylocopae TaxID=2493119 RepID=A0A366KCL5_9BIFI|nr:2'-5' RNA ligase [Bifidobacterium xylocopae]